uniref:Uncharacterized protein n=1 Tax=Arion vulgaris TaxID=1028688 RepID=A0A0B7ARM1_9EUPU
MSILTSAHEQYESDKSYRRKTMLPLSKKQNKRTQCLFYVDYIDNDEMIDKNLQVDT